MKNPLSHPLGLPLTFCAVGLIFLFIGESTAGSNAAFDRWGQEVVGTVTGSGRSSNTNFTSRYVRYTFDDGSGQVQSGRSTGNSGSVGERILIEYLSVMPTWSRVAGAGKGQARWQWWVTGFGGAFALIGLRWAFAVRRRRLRDRLWAGGYRVTGTVVRIDSSSVRYEFESPTDDLLRGQTLGSIGAPLRVGSPVDVLFDPDRPSQNVLAHEYETT